jgi:carboxylesterase
MLSNKPFSLTGTHPTKAVLMLHGYGGGVYEMQLLGEFLNQLGLTVHGIAYPGHDRPEPKMPTTTWQQWYGHVLASYQHLRQAYSQISVVGFSTGCPLALYLASQNPVDKLALLAPYLLIRRQWYFLMPVENYVNALGWLIQDVPRMRLPIFDPIMQREAMNVVFYRTFNIPGVKSAMELIELVKPKLPAIQNPTLIIQSPKDTVVDPSGAEYLYTHLGTTQKQIIRLVTSDHVISLDYEKEQVFKAVGDFLSTE